MTDAMRRAERLAAMLDGRIDEQERARLLALLAESEDALTAFADAAAVRAELGGGAADLPITVSGAAGGTDSGAGPAVSAAQLPAGTGAGTGGVTPRAGGLRGWRSPVALAAGIGAIALVAGLLARAALQPAADPRTFAALLAPRGEESVAWQGDGWASTRAAGDPLTTETRAVRVGALLVALELAVREERPHAVGLAEYIADLFAGVPGGGPAASHYQRLASLPPGAERTGMLHAGAEQAAALLPAERVLAGGWLEAARVAAIEQDAEFFRARASRTALARIRELPALPTAAEAALARIGVLVTAANGWDWGVLQTELDAALRSLAS